MLHRRRRDLHEDGVVGADLLEHVQERLEVEEHVADETGEGHAGQADQQYEKAHGQPPGKLGAEWICNELIACWVVTGIL
ncbi:MAG: hypothetical protein FJ303_25340 [Planctomycetes bacterium]|nr:hypothetical protein [Planctomycetota bacterium]